jgi:rhodanese-related sulfurtransferase
MTRLLPLLTIAVLIPYPAAGGATTISEATLGETGEKAPEVSTAELRTILETNAAIVFDARPPREFAIGHIPGAVNVKGKPGVPASQYVSDMREVERAVQGDKSTRIVLYCNGPFCGRSKRLAEDLLAAGFTHVSRYQLGMPVWRALGGLQQIERDGLRYVLENDKTAVFFDARGSSVVPWARGLALGEVKKAKDDGRLPMEDHHTRIIVIGADATQVKGVAAAIAHEAFDNVAFHVGDASTVTERR